MCTAGNSKSNSESEAATTTPPPPDNPTAGENDNDNDAEEDASDDVNNSERQEPSRHHDGSDDETSDPVVVSPSTSPRLSSSSVGDIGGEETFEDTQAELAFSPVSPPSLVSVGLGRKASPLALKSWTSLALTLDGRDKITKVFQYSTRLLAWWFASASGSKQLSLRFAALSKSLSTSRKAFRLGRSLIEMEKLYSMGLGRLLLWHLLNTMGINSDGGGKEDSKSTTQIGTERTYARRASSNLGWGPMSLEEEESEISTRRREKPSFIRSLSTTAYRAIYRPLRSTVSSLVGESSLKSRQAPTTDLWTVIGSAFKMLGLLGFWTADNINYLCSTGFLDDPTLSNDKERMEKRQKLQTLASIRANQSYFAGAVTGLLLNSYSYLKYRRETLASAEHQWREACEDGVDEDEEQQALHRLKKAKEKQFSLVLALVKVSPSPFGIIMSWKQNRQQVSQYPSFRAAVMSWFSLIILALISTRNGGVKRTMRGCTVCLGWFRLEL